jgi:hypothetical protein
MTQWAKASRKRPSILLTYSTLQWKRPIGHHEAVMSKTCKALRLSNKNILKGGHKGVAMGDQLETPP